MTEPTSAATQLIARCRQLRDKRRSEAVLRGEFLSWLRLIFTGTADNAWVNHYTEGTEAGTTIARQDGAASHGFIDTLVHSTVIEYESDLRQTSKWQRGYGQVRDYAAGTIRSGIPASQVRGVLSDTVDWYAFDVHVPDTVVPNLCTPEDVTLVEVESLSADTADEPAARRLITFVRKHLAREQSRPLNASFIATDLGLESAAYKRHSDALAKLVDDGRNADPSITLATDLWSRFVDHLERQAGGFRTHAYVDETYLAILARLLCANILEGRALLGDSQSLADILQGRYFEFNFRLRNMVEPDYFGWIQRPPYLHQVVPIAQEIQRDLYAYDYSSIIEQDMFGHLIAQLADRTERKLLGQELTPNWIAQQLVQRCLDMLPQDETPRIVDMCCGSGTILAEILKATKQKYPNLPFSQLSVAATGFDIDPLAVILAKTTWVITLTSELRAATEMVTIPIFHADSLFAVTPVTGNIPLHGTTAEIQVDLDGHIIELPIQLLGPIFRDIFDDIVDWAYDEARQAQRSGDTSTISKERTAELLEALCARPDRTAPRDLKQRIAESLHELTLQMARLALANRNGIWAFILRNTYQPGLLAGQFNGIVSNPPWLAMSQFASNPYRTTLSARAQAYGIMPRGSAHLHLELATIHLLHAVDRYLKPNGVVCCLVPGTILNGQHHARLRDRAYLKSSRPIPLDILELWGIAPGTFKVRSAAIIAVKRVDTGRVAAVQPQGMLANPAGREAVGLELRRLGARTAWVLGTAIPQVVSTTEDMPSQGADLMPRPAVCVEVLDRTGREWRVRTPRRGDSNFFTVKDAKRLKGLDFPGYVARPFIHRIAQSLNLLPFWLDANLAHVALPAQRHHNGQWSILDAAAIRTAGFSETARRFQRIDAALTEHEIVKSLADKINERNKLAQQVFSRDAYLVLNGAGGGVSCAACLPVAGHEDVVIDQTLYWCAVTSEEEAWYRVGLLNSATITEAVRQFNPPGEFGERHLHTLPNRVIPSFDSSNGEHRKVATLARQLGTIANSIIQADSTIRDPIRPIQMRRRHLRRQVVSTPQYRELERACVSVLAASHGQGP